VDTTLTVPLAAAQHLVGLLETLRELPSTPRSIATHTAQLIQRVEAELPWQWERSHGHRITIDRPTMTELAELLEVFAAMPSTPPMMAEDASHQASLVWRELEP